MTYPRPHQFSLFLAIFIFSTFISQAQQTDDFIGLTLLRTEVTNINGSGIRVGQPEANLTTNSVSWFEVNPTNVNQPTSLFTYISSLGIANTYTNNVGTNSWHGDGVGRIFYGIPNGVATNVAHVDNFDADYYFDHDVFGLLPAQGDTVVSQSFAWNGLQVSGVQQIDSIYDNYEETFGTLFVSSVNNIGNSATVTPPGTAYNGIGVGAYAVPGYGNGVGPTIDNGRCKPDITAISGDTSFSVPQVSGAAADLMQAALRGDGGSDTNSAFNLRTIKALLLNGAVKPLGWTNSSSSPLDARYGAGVVNVYNSYVQLAGGKHGSIISQLISAGAAHLPTGAAGTIPVLSGWDFNTNTSSASPARDAVSHYYFNVSNKLAGATFTATATLVWNRHLNQTGINNLSLFLYNCANNNLVNCSTSLVDNIEHIYQTSLPPGRYDLQVWKAGGTGIITPAEPYALAFEFYSDTLNLTGSGTNAAVTWPVYPAGFLVQAVTNLVSPNWTNLTLPQPVITNSMNSLQLGPTNGNLFFRLRRPNL